jgi:RNA polymerase sigma-70 factor (ECF subfamily)
MDRSLKVALARRLVIHSSWSRNYIALSQLARSVQSMLVDGAVGLVWAPRGRLARVLSFTITRGKIVQVNVMADPARLRGLDLAVLKG